MLTLTLTLLVAANPEVLGVSSPPLVPLETPRLSKVRLRKKERAARLLTADERSEYDRLAHEIKLNSRPMGSKVLVGVSMGVMTLGLAVPMGVLAIGAVGSVILGFLGIFGTLFGSTAFFELIGPMWVAMFSVIPVWGWIAVAAVTAFGAGILVVAELADGPRRAKGGVFKHQQGVILKTALKREQAPATMGEQAPTTMVPVLTF